MKKLTLIIILGSFCFCSFSCRETKNESSDRSSETSSSVKCPNCGSSDTRNYEHGGIYCNFCEVVTR